MEFEIDGNPDYGQVSVKLGPGEKLSIESGAMSRMTPTLEMRSRIMGGIVPGLLRKVFGGESLFVGEYGGPRGGELTLSPSLPGTVVHRHLEGEELMLTASSFVACTPGIDISVKFGGMRAFFSGEGAFLLRVTGNGDLFFNAYGAVLERELDGDLRVDTGHVVAWTPGIDYTIGGMGGLKSTLFSGEGLTMNFSGQGTIWLQSRNLPATVGWLSPFCVG